jgi:hypothetical protein
MIEDQTLYSNYFTLEKLKFWPLDYFIKNLISLMIINTEFGKRNHLQLRSKETETI